MDDVENLGLVNFPVFSFWAEVGTWSEYLCFFFFFFNLSAQDKNESWKQKGVSIFVKAVDYTWVNSIF